MNKCSETILRIRERAKSEFAEDYLILQIPEFASKKFITYCSMKEDLKLILSNIEMLRNQSNSTLQYALTFSIVTLYAKCFADASKNNYPKLEFNHIFNEEIELIATHDMLINLRHQLIAHRGATEKEIGIAFMLMSKGNLKDSNRIEFIQLKQNSFNDKEIKEIFSLINFIIEKLNSKIEVAVQKLYDGFIKMFPVEEQFLMIINDPQ